MSRYPLIAPFRLRIGGLESCPFETLEEALRLLAQPHAIARIFFGWMPVRSMHWMHGRDLEDFYGTEIEIVDELRVHVPLCEVLRVRASLHRRFRRPRPHRFRDGPVPHTRCFRGGGYCYFRSIRTMQERRAWEAACDDDGEPVVRMRSRRNPRNLPSAWDDLRRTNQRNWKRHRRTQWKAG